MSVYQCQKCGCIENTACSNCSSNYYNNNELKNAKGRTKEALFSYLAILGLKEFVQLCSACSPIWFNKEGNYGIGPNPDRDLNCNGKWHGRFKRTYLPKGQFKTGSNGNLEHLSNKNFDYKGAISDNEYE